MVVRRERVVSGAPTDIWRIVSDPARLPAWWPGVSRVEDASREAWTTVLVSPKGKAVRADYSLVEAREPERLLWKQEVEESPFERLLSSASTEIALEPEASGGTRVRLAIDQHPRGWARFSPFQLRAAARRQAEEALVGLAELLGDET
ncbi:MAG TPA: SRPBCC family protein [Thermoleophilaceae bacterium]|nr:SRPBCC family protein [Thermoleophilaceae bacterium]